MRPYNPKEGASLKSRSDEELIQCYLLNKDNQVVAILFDRYIHLVFASCMKYFKDEQVAQDAAMEIFETIGDKLLKHEINFFKSWLYTVTRNHCLMELRRSKPENNIQNIENFYEYSVENEFFLHLNSKEEEKSIIVHQYLNELKEEQKICIELMYLKGKTYKDIVAETGFDLKNVKSYIQNGKRNLKLLLEKHHGR